MSVICQLYIYDIIYPLLASYITHLAILVKVLILHLIYVLQIM